MPQYHNMLCGPQSEKVTGVSWTCIERDWIRANPQEYDCSFMDMYAQLCIHSCCTSIERMEHYNDAVPQPTANLHLFHITCQKG